MGRANTAYYTDGWPTDRRERRQRQDPLPYPITFWVWHPSTRGGDPYGSVCKYRYSTAQKLDGHGAPADDTIWSVLVFRSIPTVYYTVVVVTLDKNYVPMSQL